MPPIYPTIFVACPTSNGQECAAPSVMLWFDQLPKLLWQVPDQTKHGSSFDWAPCESLVTFMACNQADPFVSSISSSCATTNFTGTLALCLCKCRIPVLSWSHAVGIVHASCPTSFTHAKTLRTPWGGSSAGTWSHFSFAWKYLWRPPKPFSVINSHRLCKCLLGTTPEELARSIRRFEQMLLHGDGAVEQCAIVVLSRPSSWTIHLKFMRTMCSAKGASRVDQI